MVKIMVVIYTFLLWVLLGCEHTMVTKNETPIVVKDSLIFRSAVSLGVISEKEMDEISGITVSNVYTDHIWCHNDSGDKARLFLINQKAELVHTVYIENVKNRDWEDMAIYKNPASGRSMIYIADIGDNKAKYDYSQIHIIEEPNLNLDTKETTVSVSQTITYTYPEGPRDAETLMIDPANGDIYIISKRENQVGLFKIPFPYPNEKIVAKKITDLPYTYIVAGDIASDRSAIVIKDYNSVYHFSLVKDQKIEDALLEKPYLPPYVREPQGESICWSMDSKSFFTLSEESPGKIHPVLYRYDKGR
jgi:hypothetical protein